jgi:hypothetical protein
MAMRKWIGVLVAAAALVALAALPAGAGNGGGAPLTVRKVPVGPVPAGTQFVVTVACDGEIIHTGNGPASSAQLVFDAQGNPVGPDTVTFDDGGSCTVTETQNGGASSVIYECQGTLPPEASITGGGGPFSARAVGRRQICQTTGPQSDPIALNIVNREQEATVTVTNTFVAQPPPAPAAAVEDAPRFTG